VAVDKDHVLARGDDVRRTGIFVGKTAGGEVEFLGYRALCLQRLDKP
jgi:hypothetical protein